MADYFTISAGRDNRHFHGYEFHVFDGEEIVAHGRGFKSKAAAQRHGLKAAQALAAGAR